MKQLNMLGIGVCVLFVASCRPVDLTSIPASPAHEVQIAGLDSAIYAESGTLYAKGFKIRTISPDSTPVEGVPVSLQVIEGDGEAVSLTDHSGSEGEISALYFTLIPAEPVTTVLLIETTNVILRASIAIHPLPPPDNLQIMLSNPHAEGVDSVSITVDCCLTGKDSRAVAEKQITLALDGKSERIIQPDATDGGGRTSGRLIVPRTLDKSVTLTATHPNSLLEFPAAESDWKLLNLLPVDQQVGRMADALQKPLTSSPLTRTVQFRVEEGSLTIMENGAEGR